MSGRSPYRALLIGVGAPTASPIRGGGHQIGYTHAASFARNPQVELVGAADIDRSHLAAFLRVYPEPKAYDDYRRALRELRPDVVSVCTYVGLHKEIVEACVEGGVRGIFCEKPFVNSPKELRDIHALVSGSSSRLIVAHIRRYLPAYRKARELVRRGAIGRLLLAAVGLDGWDLSEMGSHYFDLIRMFYSDEPIRHVFGQVRATGAEGYGHAMEDHAIAYFEFEAGGRGLVDGGSGLPFTLQGSEGTIVLSSEQSLAVIDKEGYRLHDFADDPASAWNSLWDHTLADLLAWMEGGPEPETGIANAARTAEANLAAYVSALRGDRVDLPLDDDLDEWPVNALVRRSRISPSVPCPQT